MTQKFITQLGQDNIMVEAQALQVLMSRTVPLATQLSSAAWADDAKTAADNGIIDLSAVFGAPANIRAAFVWLVIADGTIGVACRIGPTNGAWALGQTTQVANQSIEVAGMVPCDANGDFYIAFTGNIDHVWLYITGYVI